jgi:hypothetical protein
MNTMVEHAPSPSTFPPAPAFARGAVAILDVVESLGRNAAGALHFGRAGVVLVNGGEISWATAANMQRRLLHRLRRQRNPPLDRAQIASVFESCRSRSLPVREALVESGLLSEAGVRAAFFRHTVDAIAQLSMARAPVTEFVEHGTARADPRFSFSPAEVLAGFGARSDEARAAAARVSLRALPDVVEAIAIDTEPTPTLIAVADRRRLPIAQILEGVECTANLLRGGAGPAMAEWYDDRELVAWRRGDVGLAAICSSAERPALDEAVRLSRVTS